MISVKRQYEYIRFIRKNKLLWLAVPGGLIIRCQDDDVMSLGLPFWIWGKRSSVGPELATLISFMSLEEKRFIVQLS